MNLKRLYEMQKVLDDRIIEKHGLEDQDLLPNLILALQVELGECANEWRGFKHWSKDREPRTEVYTTSPLPNEPLVVKENPLLEEYVDCLHFILSIGNRIGYQMGAMGRDVNSDTTMQFNSLFRCIGEFHSTRSSKAYQNIWRLFLGLGEMLGFTWEQIEQAYMQKNEVNHSRQESGY